MTQIATMGMITLECDHILKCEVRRDLGSIACMLNHFSGVRLFPTLWTVAHQAPLSVGFFRQEHWSGLPRLPPRGLPDPGIESTLLAGGSLPLVPPGKPCLPTLPDCPNLSSELTLGLIPLNARSVLTCVYSLSLCPQ